MSFQDDIKGQNTQLYPVVKIGEDYYSTNNVTVDGNYCKPILMNIPTIKESIDIESRKFKISNVSLEFNNFPFDGVRFSDQLSESSLINTEATIYFKSPSDLQEVFKGIIRRISHDDSKVSVELEDSTEQKAHKDLPQTLDRNGVVGYLGGGNSIPDKYKNKPIPICYGHVDRSPVVISSHFNKYQVDSKEILGFITTDSGFTRTSGAGIWLDPLQVDMGGNILHIVRGGQYNEPELGGNAITLSNNIDNQDGGIEEATLLCRQIPTPRLSIKNPEDDALSNDDFLGVGYEIDSIDAISDGLQATNTLDLYGARTVDFDNEDNLERLLLSLRFDITPQHDTTDGNNTIIGFRVNENNLPNYLGDKVVKIVHYNGLWGQYGDVTSISDTYDLSGYIMIADTDIDGTALRQSFKFNHVNQPEPPDIEPDISYYSEPADILLNFLDDGTMDAQRFMPLILFSGGVTNSFNIDFRVVVDLGYGQGDYIPRIELIGDVNEIDFVVESNATKLFKNEFYANVKGRINTFNDHPDAPTDDFIENPIDIIYDLVKSELGHDAINEAEYTEAKLAHVDWKFGFSQTKKISSKKLIEDIAKSTKCFPKFKNDGTFGFNTIKDSYDVDNDYAGATPIKESEVISYSFKKTKPEQIYKKVTVSYNKDYAQDSYLKTALSEDLGDDPYYGIENSSDAHLEFESDYIRHSDNGATADKLASFLSGQYKNDHLMFNLKLPLQYINLEIGDLVKFEDLFQGIKAYGIDYTILQPVNGQQRFPLFMVTASTKSLDSVSIECMQLHALVPVNAEDWNEETPEPELDTTAPVITVLNNTTEYYVGDTLIPFAANATDDTDGAVAVTVTFDNNIYNNAILNGEIYGDAGTFNVFYDAVDDAGNAAATITQFVTINEVVIPPTDDDLIYPPIELDVGDAGIIAIQAVSSYQLRSYSNTEFTGSESAGFAFNFYDYPNVFIVNELIEIHGKTNAGVDIIVRGLVNSIPATYISSLNGFTITTSPSGYQLTDLVSTSAWSIYAVNPNTVLSGDANEDGILNILDIVFLVSEILGTQDWLGQDDVQQDFRDRMDMNGDGGLNILDIVILVDEILNP